ncbi:MAG TPA: glycosyltransferase family 39 protein [Candidatus Sulfotelmatobacter sp.]|nr:glycosyltransferase family 39 protein [Candidatus Sulfotelmatobacter sp.]
MNFKISKKIELILLLIIFSVGFLVRFYRFNGPVADWHSWRQADTSAVSRNFVANGFDLLHPTFDDLSNVPSGIYDNPKGYRFVEFPIYNVLQAGSFMIFGHLTIEEWGRLVSIFASLFSAVFLYLIVKKRENFLTGILAAGFFLLLPFNVFYSRTILPDPLMITFILGSIYFFDLWINKDKFSIFSIQFFITLFFAIGAFLIKPFAAFFMLPMLYLSFEKFGINFIKRWQLWVFAFFSVLPFGLWRLWIQQFPAGIPQSSWLFNSNNIRFTGSFFHWIFARRIGDLILGFWGLFIFVLGFLVVNKKNLLYFLSFILSSFIYVNVVATGNVQHSYYQIPIIPSIAIFLGIGSAYLLSPKNEQFSRLKTIPILIICLSFMFAFSWFSVRDYFNINNRSIVIAGQAVDKLIPQNAKVIAPYNGDTSFLYQTKRKGWASFEKPLPQLIKMGADYLVLVNPKPQDYGIGKEYKIVSATSDYILFDLHKKP